MSAMVPIVAVSGWPVAGVLGVVVPGPLLEVMICRRGDGREVRLDELPLAHEFRNAETVRAEEIELSVPDGRRVTTLVNSTPIYTADGAVESVVVTMQDLAPLEELERLRAEVASLVDRARTTFLSAGGRHPVLIDLPPVLLDLMLPGADGIELTTQVPELADLPVIFISGYGHDETIARALEAGATDYIVKPFSPTELVRSFVRKLRRKLGDDAASPTNRSSAPQLQGRCRP